MTYRYSSQAMSQLHEVMPERDIVSWDDFCQRVRAYPHIPLLRRIAAQSSATFNGTPMTIDPSALQPWALAEIAREALAYGNPHRHKPITDDTLDQLHTLYENLEDPLLRDADGDLWAWELRTVHEQFRFQGGIYSDLARFAVLFDRDFPAEVEVLTRELITELLGADPAIFVNTAMLLTVSTMKNAGVFNTAWLGQPQFQDIVSQLPAETITEVLTGLFAAPLNVVIRRAREKRHPDRTLRRYDPNPLLATPYIQVDDTEFLAPVPRFVADRATLEGIYYAGMQRWEARPPLRDAFLRDLGRLVETYVGEQLHQLPGVVTGERTYGKGGGQRTVDWIVVLDDVVLLIEVKNARVSARARLDIPAWTRDVQADVGKAMKQISTTAALMRGGHLALADVPLDRPLRGIVVTAEPHHLINSPIFRRRLTEPTIPTTVLSMNTLELAVAHGLGRDTSQTFLALTDYDHEQGIDINNIMSNWSREAGSGRRPPNPVLDKGWQRLDWIARETRT